MIAKWPQLKLDKFDTFCLLLLLPIVVFALTPSSYGAALSLFGFEGEGLLFGQPRMIRTDEWAVWTPYIQMAVLNDFERFNQLSTYHHDLRGFNGVPLADWALVFKPLMWPFWVFEPARAFALHHGLVIVLFLMGWKRLFAKIYYDIAPSSEKALLFSALMSVLLFFTGFVQFWWTTLGPLLAITPWFLSCLLNWQHSVTHYAKLFYISTVWLLSHTYPPIIIAVAYFGVALLCIHRWQWWKSSLNQLAMTTLACIASVAVMIFYYHEIISVMLNTVYPGQRASQGGESLFVFWLSNLFPYINHSGYQNLILINICEVGALGSVLALATGCFVRPNWKNTMTQRALMFMGGVLLLATVWMLLPVPPLLAKVLLLDKIPGSRMIFIAGLAISYLSFVIVITGTVFFSKLRLFIFSVLMLAGYFIPTFLGNVAWFTKSGPELMVISLALFIYIVQSRIELKPSNKKLMVLLLAMIPNIIVYGRFNPIQQAFPIFDLHQRSVVNELKLTASPTAPHWVITDQYRGALLSGLGINSFTSVLIQPQLSLFKQMYPNLSQDTFNDIFNRYAHIFVSYDITAPEAPFLDQIHIPIWDVKEVKPEQIYQESREYFQAQALRGFVDSVEFKNDFIVIRGWADFQHGYLAGKFKDEDIAYAKRQKRPDVAKALSDSNMLNSGFILMLKRTPDTMERLNKSGVCIFSVPRDSSVNLLATAHLPEELHCRKGE
ncbi:DUF7657 domain-containing protein [Vibrio metschnikovii]|uniref:DUF7657 domain-containing protein n=1 Tax=Vibrio metschnikovii TaxID=28172 RepID=UPI001C2F6D97|nr:hypothetical protein [Vibrio metschnikovii]